jgi:hypothetical protein
MRKLIMTICAIVLTGWWTYAQEVSNETSYSARSIHVALSPSTSALIGVHGGLLGNSGGILGGGDLISSGGIYLAARYNDRSIMTNDRLSVDLGISLQLIEPLHIFVGGGYGEYKYPYKEPTILPDKEITGYEIEGGAILKLGQFTLHGGVSTLKFEHLDVFGGIGYTF